MSSSGPNNPSSVTTSGLIGTNNNWSTTTNCYTENGSYAVCYSGGGISSTYGLVVTGFGFSLSSSATIDGIVVEVKGYDGDRANVSWNASRIVKGGTIQSTNVFPAGGAATVPTTNEYRTFGTSTELWGTTWSYSDINDSNFGYAVSILGQATGNSYVDHIRITVYYTVGGSSYVVSSSKTMRAMLRR